MEKVLYLSRNDVEKVGPPMEEIIENIEWMFRKKGEGRLEAPPKPASHPRKDSFVVTTQVALHQDYQGTQDSLKAFVGGMP